MGDKILGRANKDSKKSLHYQTMLRLYLKSYREDQGWTQADLAEKLSCSKQSIEVMEHRTKPSAPVTALLALEKLGSLRDLPADSFAAIMLGKKNEEGEENQFLLQMIKDIGQLSDSDQLRLRKILKKKKELSKVLRLMESYVGEKSESQKLYEMISQLSDIQKKNLNGMLQSFVEKQDF